MNVTALDPDETEINTTPAIVVNETELYIRRNNITSNPEELLPHLSSDYSTIVYPIEDIILDSTGFISGKSILSHHLPILYNRYTIYKFRTIYDADLWRNTTCEQTRQILLERYYDINHNPGPCCWGIMNMVAFQIDMAFILKQEKSHICI